MQNPEFHSNGPRRPKPASLQKHILKYEFSHNLSRENKQDLPRPENGECRSFLSPISAVRSRSTTLRALGWIYSNTAAMAAKVKK